MANLIKWSALGTYTTAIAGSGAAPVLKALASATLLLGNEIDNATTTRDQYAYWDLYVRGASAFTAGTAMYVWFLLAVDGTNYEDGAAGVQPGRSPDLIFPVRAVSTQQRIAANGGFPLLLPATKFKCLFLNSGGQALTNTDAENILSYRPVNDEIQ